VASGRSALVTAWWATAGVAELTIAIVLLVYGKWWTIFGTAPATAVCVYFVLKERDRARG
jgi:hypothetical protein